MSESLKIGQIIAPDREEARDAIHVAVAPVTAKYVLAPGCWVVLTDTEGPVACSPKLATGIVDPFLTRMVAPGERFWLFLKPGSITSLRHNWTHPAFEEKLAALPDDPASISRRWLEDIAGRCGVSYERMIGAVEEGDYINMGDNEEYRNVLDPVYDEFKKHCEVVLGKPVAQYAYPFSCAC